MQVARQLSWTPGNVWTVLKRNDVHLRVELSKRKKLPPDAELIGSYKESGIYALSKKYGVSERVIRRKLSKLGVVDSTRKFTKIPRSSVRRRDKRTQDFLGGTKKLCFEREHGLCQECQLPVGNWRQGCYHHKIPLYKGGNNMLDNCQLYHGVCHFRPAVFERLHGFKPGDYYSAKEE